ncbi:MAG: DUF418 domain-containing protein, partial [Spirochaetaceae bacterium]
MSNRSGPDQTAPHQRIQSLDLIRGVAILGILFMNIMSMGAPQFAYYVPEWYEGAGTVDHAIYAVQSLFVESRFFSLFALLFGAGLAIQWDRFEARGARPKRWISRRLLWLLLFGLLHGFLIWLGDILTLYALTGLLVYRWANWPVRRMIKVGVLLVLIGQLALLAAFAGSIASGQNIMQIPELPYSAPELGELRDRWTGLSRVGENAALFLSALAFIPLSQIWHTAGVMLFGMALYRSGFFRNSDAWKKALPWALLGLLGAGALLRLRYALDVDSSASYATMSMMMIPGLLMAIGYASVLVAVGNGSSLILRAFRNAGKMAFTFYISQSVVVVT